MLVDHIKSFLPRSVRRPLGHVRRSCEAPFYYLRGKKILHDYSRHYNRARRIFRAEGNAVHPVVRSLKDLGVRVVSFGARSNIINLPANYLDLVERVRESAQLRFGPSKACSFFPKLVPQLIPDRTEDIAAIRNGDVITIQLTDPFDIEGLEELCRPIMEELEQKIYRSYAIVDKVYVYRSPVSRQIPDASWLWHYDNHPHAILKVMIYLTDVSDQSAPFEYLRCAKSLKPVLGSPLAPLYGASRISERVLARYFSKGFEGHKVTGPRGTIILFDNNIIHKGNLALQTYRDVITFQTRPVSFKRGPYIDPRWTGSFQQAPFNQDPNDFPSSTRPRHFSKAGNEI